MSRTQLVDAVIKVYIPDHSSRYFDVTVVSYGNLFNRAGHYHNAETTLYTYCTVSATGPFIAYERIQWNPSITDTIGTPL